MTESRYPAKSNNKKLIHSLKQVADELITYVKELQTVRELVQHVDAAGKEYARPLNSWFWYPIYAFTRLRGPEVSMLINSLNQSGSSETLLEAVDQFFSNGRWTTTSANTYLMIELALGLPGYADTKAKMSLEFKDILELRDLFLERSRKILHPEWQASEAVPELSAEERQQELMRKQQVEVERQLELQKILKLERDNNEAERLYRFELQRKIELEKELQHLPRRNIKLAADELTAATHFLLKRSPVNKLDNKKYGALKTELNGIYQNILLKKGLIKAEAIRNQPATERVTMQNKVGKLNPERIKSLDVQLGHMLEAAAKDYTQTRAMEAEMEEITVAPKELCAAAFEAPVVSAPISGEAKEIVLNGEQSAAMMRLFGSTQKLKVKPPKNEAKPDGTPSPVASR